MERNISSFNIITDAEKQADYVIQNEPTNEMECINYNNSLLEEPFCKSIWDSFYCWPSTASGKVVSRPCSVLFASYDVGFRGSKQNAEAYRVCDENGRWLWGNWTNYTQCLDLLPHSQETEVGHLTVCYILFICSFISIIALLITLLIFCYFKSLHCSRLRVHRNLAVSLIIHSVLLMIIPSTVIFQTSLPNYTEVEWLCKLLMCIKMYSAMASINWMFVEGLLLHSRITVSVFKQDAPFKLYYLIGWGLPLIFVSSWAFIMSCKLHTPCWRGYGKSIYVWILTGPMVIALLVNSVFMVNIVRILITKLNRTSSIDSRRMKQKTERGGSMHISAVHSTSRDSARINWKAVRATALLFPLLGLTHLMFCINPNDDAMFEEAYMLTNAILQSSQGFFVGVLYCFMNSEVQTVVRNSYLRAVIRRNPNTRTKSYLRTSNAFLSHTEISVADTARNKVVPDRKIPLQIMNGEEIKDTERTYVF
ncbi:corticotropin-releasing factor receptor 2-like [Parasteatoda tepidariorum]|uniref:corticotropin-releasing factor receptor 2-like n=1 Tax=Parasteatoda tepidariorum TaxID=114398 RepID=UPI000A2C0D6A|nr:corticotropin-releasing factor receptor 2-like [Parasteatoda tepidariorum]